MKKELFTNNEPMTITDMEALCRNSIELIRYARGLAVRHINIIELMTNYALGAGLWKSSRTDRTGRNMEHG